MNFYAGVLGEIFIVEFFVFIIWLRVLVDAISAKDKTVAGRKFLLTSIGLLINAFAVGALMIFRAYELQTGQWPYVPYVSAFFVMLGIAGFLWILAASIAGSTKLLKAFLICSAMWVAYCLFVSIS
jgi:hypothetical protein